MARKKRNDHDALVGGSLAALGVLLLAGLAGLAWWFGQSPQRSAATNCPAAGPAAIHVIMIDRSDPITPSQVQRIQQHLQRVKQEAPEDTRLDVYSFEGSLSDVLEPAISICAPRKPEDADPWIEGPIKVRALYQRFSKRLEDELNAMLTAHTQPTSPIIESLRGAAQTSFGSIVSRQLPLKVTLISDLVQNTKNVSHLRTAPDFGALERSNLWSSLRPDLKGADVDVLYLLRPSAVRAGQPVQNVGHQQFWEALLRASGGRPLGIWPVGGVQ